MKTGILAFLMLWNRYVDSRKKTELSVQKVHLHLLLILTLYMNIHAASTYSQTAWTQDYFVMKMKMSNDYILLTRKSVGKR